MTEAKKHNQKSLSFSCSQLCDKIPLVHANLAKPKKYNT